MPEPERDWTLMFYFASDNPLAPAIVSQLKSLKNAGFNHEVNVIAQFDPHMPDTPTHIFDVNRVNKMKFPKNQIGFRGNDPFVRNLVLDKLWRDEKNDKGELLKEKLTAALKLQNIDYHAPEPPPFKTETEESKEDKASEKKSKPDVESLIPSELSPKESLNSFLQFCANKYPARRFMLFLIGHGVVVGNDMFLFDADASSDSLTLKNLKELLTDFNKTAGDGRLELVSMHSCSMSSIEVSYELKGQANYLLASQGPAFVGSWPYREILVRIFSHQEDNVDFNTTVTKIFDFVLFNSFDFQLAGYSFDLCLSRLNEDFTPLTTDLSALTALLREGLDNALVQQLIILAHWDAQSYWKESYTDLFDFCNCLHSRCAELEEVTAGSIKLVTDLGKQCEAVCKHFHRAGIAFFDPGNLVDIDHTPAEKMDLIVRAEFAGPESQYSHGLSVYFPWSEPIDHSFWEEAYPEYEFKVTGWRDFLKDYFDKTMREPIHAQPPYGATTASTRQPTIQQELLEEITCKIFNVNGLLSSTLGDKPGGTSGMGDGDKPGGTSGVGPGDKPGGTSGAGPCDCPTIKNYPSFTRKRLRPDKNVNPPMSDFFKGFFE